MNRKNSLFLWDILHIILWFFFISKCKNMKKWMKNGIILFMSIIMCTGTFTLDQNLSKSALTIVWLLFTQKNQVKTKSKPIKIFTASCCHFSLVNFHQVNYIIKKTNSRKNVYEWIKTWRTQIQGKDTMEPFLSIPFKLKLSDICHTTSGLLFHGKNVSFI